MIAMVMMEMMATQCPLHGDEDECENDHNRLTLVKINVEFMSLNIDNDGLDVNLATNIDFADDDIGCDG